jgi:hypothetical protein
MKEYEFTLKFNLQNSQVAASDYVEKLYENGCDDALIGIGAKGYIALDFIREASSAYAAVSSAISDVKNVIPHAVLIEATPDFVGLTDAAKILGCSRQNIRNLIVKDAPRSPLPVYEGTPSIWHLADILNWLGEEKTYAIDNSLLEISQINMNFNMARSWQRLDSELQENIKDLLPFGNVQKDRVPNIKIQSARRRSRRNDSKKRRFVVYLARTSSFSSSLKPR